MVSMWRSLICFSVRLNEKRVKNHASHFLMIGAAYG